MFGLSYGELFLLLGASAALLGPKDMPIIAKAAGRLVGRSVGYIQLVRGQLDNVMNQSQASQVHKEVQEAMSQLEAIRHEIRSMSFINPGPLTRRLDVADPPPNNGTTNAETATREFRPQAKIPKDFGSMNMSSMPSRLLSEATTYAMLAETQCMDSAVPKVGGNEEKHDDDSGLFSVLPVSAETAGFLPKRSDKVEGSDIMLEAILEADVACKAKLFFSQPENQMPKEPSGNSLIKHDSPEALPEK